MKKRIPDSYEYFVRNLRTLADRYEGEYVAIVRDKIVAHGKDAKVVYDAAQERYPHDRIFIGQVPLKEALVLWFMHHSLSLGRDRELSE